MIVKSRPSLSILPGTLHHDVVRQFHRKQNTNNVKKNILYLSKKIINCTTASLLYSSPNVHMCIFNLQVLCSWQTFFLLSFLNVYLFIYLFISNLLLFVKRGTTKWKCLYIIMIIIDFFPLVLPLVEKKRQLHILLSIF